MKILYDFYPKIGDTTSVSFTSSVSASEVFPVSNLFYLEPARCFKTTSTAAFNLVIDLKSSRTIDTIFLNRINFSKYTVAYSSDNSTYTNIVTRSDLTIDEISEEQYIHDIVVINSPITARYIRISVQASKAVFETSYYKIGNIFIGKSVDIINPKNGFQVKYQPNMNITTFKSGYISRTKLGRTKRVFSGDFDKLDSEIIAKFKLTYNPFVIWLDYTGKTTSCYLVMNTEEFTQTYDFATVKSMNFNLEEIV